MYYGKMKIGTEKYITRHNGKGNFEVVYLIATKHGNWDITIAPNTDWETASIITKALNKHKETKK